MRIHDVDGRWQGAEISIPSENAAEYTCSVPWWVLRIRVDAQTKDGGRQLATVRNAGSLWWSGGAHEEHALLGVGDNEVWVDFGVTGEDGAEGAGRPVLLHTVREDPLRSILPHLRSYEVAQLSVVLFIVGLYVAVHSGLPSLVAVPALAVIPVSRICPELLCFLRGLPGGARLQVHRALTILAACLVIIWVVFLTIVAARNGGGLFAAPATPQAPRPPLEADRHLAPRSSDCSILPGLDCSRELALWAGEENCAVLAETNGSCSSYCERWNRTCLKAMDDDGSGRCMVDEAGHLRQSSEQGGCAQSWHMQVCACSGHTALAILKLPQPRPPSPSPTPPRPVLVPQPVPSPPLPETRLGPPEPQSHVEEPRGAPPESGTGLPELASVEAEVEPCFFLDTAYWPLNMPMQGRTVTVSPQTCQARCARTPGCGHFTWLRDGSCHIQEYRAQRHVGVGAIAGPSSCSDEEELEALLREPQPTLDDVTVREGKTQQISFTSLQARLELPSEGSPTLVAVVFAAFIALAVLGVVD